jgi:MFS transporter, ACS family, hexuronate transporter
VQQLRKLTARTPAGAWLMICLSQAMVGFFYLDRQNLAALKQAMGPALGITSQAYGSIVSLFLAAYAVSYFVTGWIVDRAGVRHMFPFFVGLMSIATLCSGLARDLEQFTLCRVILGFAQAGVMPASLVALTKWIPAERRASVASLTKPISYAAQLMATPLPVILAAHWSWRLAFILPGAIGMLAAVSWWCLDRPDRSLAATQGPGWMQTYRASLAQRDIRVLILARAITDPAWFFALHWQSNFLIERMRFSEEQLAKLGWLPTAAKILGGIALALIIDRKIASGSLPAVVRTRALQAMAAMAPAIGALAWIDNPAWALALLSLLQIVGAAWLTLSTILMADLCGDRFTGSNVALMDGTGLLVSSIASLFTAWLIRQAGYGPLFFACGLAYPIAACVLQASMPAERRYPIGAGVARKIAS